MMNVLYLTNVPSPYRVDFFNEFGKSCHLTVLFEKAFSNERDNSWKNYEFKNFKGIFLKGISLNTDTAICFSVLKYLKNRSFDRIICDNFSSPTGLLAVLYMQKHKMRYFIETDGGTPKSKKGLKERLKKKVIQGASGCFSTGAENDRYFLAYGAEKEKIYRYPFTSLYASDVYENTVSDSEKSDLRAKLGIQEKFVIISVGRFTYLNGYGKGYDVLIKAAERLPKEIGWYVIGGQPTEEFSQMVLDKKLDNFHFIDFKQKEDLKEYYRATDLFVLMTVGEAWGLVINEAMACGLPVITTDKCIAGLELVENGENGYIVPVGDYEMLAEKVHEIFDQNRMGEMGKRSIEKIKDYTIEQMAHRHISLFETLKDET